MFIVEAAWLLRCPTGGYEFKAANHPQTSPKRTGARIPEQNRIQFCIPRVLVPKNRFHSTMPDVSKVMKTRVRVNCLHPNE